ncbi:MAG: insulinase family protein [Chlamydiales bacterium]|nr:insulinase family protein [Chlamydiales bacterium]
MQELNQTGDLYKEFELTKILPISELQSTLRELVHLPTGAQIMHLENKDPENVFSLLFKTLPSSSNGSAHIVEHTVLCGSEKFPIKDPFFSMTKRSLHTYMNALTGPDFTCYPAASQVQKDFYNLLEVYLDAVFKPHLKHLSFLQEGHRLEFTDPENIQSPLIHKGIVFNEMKGCLASPDTRLWKKMMQFLFPTLPYGYNAGGDPEEIAKLTYQELLDFYKTYYHPSRCLFYFYGNIPLQQHLDFLLKETLSSVKKADPLPVLNQELRFKTPQFHTDVYPLSDEKELSEKVMLSIGFLTCSIKNQRDWLALQVLDLVLMGTDASPLKQALLKSHLCKQADSYIDSDMTEVPFIFICKGCTEENAKKIGPFILKALAQIIKDGISEELIESAIHQLEFSRSEITGTHSPFGLSLFMRSALLKQHGVEAEEGLKIHSLFDMLRKSTKDLQFLPSLITKYFIDNPHQVELIMKPDLALSERELMQEQEELKEVRKKMSEYSAKELVEQTKKLKLFQEEQEHNDIEVLPKVTLADVSENPKEFTLIKEKHKGLDVLYHECFTNQIVYADLHFTAPPIEVDELVYLRLFCTFLPEIGCKDRTYQQNLEYIQNNIGGINAFFSLHVHAEDSHLFKPTFGFKGKALKRKADKLFLLIKDMIESANFGEKIRLKELLQQHLSSLESSLTSNALKYALHLSTRSFSIPNFITDSLYGLSYLQSLRSIAQEFEKDPNTLINHLKSLQERLMGIEDAKLVISADLDSYNYLKTNDFFGLAALCKKQNVPFFHNYSIPEAHSQAHILSAPVSFNSMSLPIISYAHPDAAYLNIATQLFENKVLHKKIREQGGAYGGGASSNTLTGCLSFYSYRDPHIALSLKAFKESAESIAKGAFDARDIEDAQLGLLQDLDGPIAPGHRASVAFSWLLAGKTFDKRKKYRTTLLKATKEDIQRAVKEHILPHLNQGIIVSFAGKALLEKEMPLLEKENFPKLPLYTV